MHRAYDRSSPAPMGLATQQAQPQQQGPAPSNAALAAQVTPLDAVPSLLDEVAVSQPEGWRNLVDAVAAAKGAALPRTVTALTSWCRTHLPDLPRLEAYLAQPDLDPQTKTATVGRLVAALARNEFLLGSIFHGPAYAGWETDGTNAGPYVDHYIGAVRLDRLNLSGKDMPWCTSFVGSQVLRAGYDVNGKAAGATEGRSPFWSGARLERYAETGRNMPNNGRSQVLRGKGDRVIDEEGSQHVDAAKYKALSRDLAAAGPELEPRMEVLNAFLAKHGTPQAGDILVLGTNNAYTGRSKSASHTILVERYDPSDGMVFAIEGNAAGQVKGRTLQLSNADDVSKMIHRTRLGVEQFDDAGSTYTGRGPGPAPTEAVSEQTLLGPVQAINAALASVAIANKSVRGTDASTSVSELDSGFRRNHYSGDTR